MPSTSEGWGMALIQAVACGTPVVASRYVPSAFALKDLDIVKVEHEVNDPKRLAKSTLTVLENAPSRARDRNRIFNSLVLQFSWENYARPHVEVYKKFT